MVFGAEARLQHGPPIEPNESRDLCGPRSDFPQHFNWFPAFRHIKQPESDFIWQFKRQNEQNRDTSLLLTLSQVILDESLSVISY